MSAFRIFSRSCSILRQSSIVSQHVRLPIREGCPRRLFTSSVRFNSDDSHSQPGEALPVEVLPVETDASGEGSGELARDLSRTIMLRRIPEDTFRGDIEELFSKEGLEITRIKLPFDRFTLANIKCCFVELANKSQADHAKAKFQAMEMGNDRLTVRDVRDSFSWDIEPPKFSRFFQEETKGDVARKAIEPLLERRRFFIELVPPRGSGGPSAEQSRSLYSMLELHLSPLGLEAVSDVINLHKRGHRPRLGCWIDMKTQRGVEEARKIFHYKYIQGWKTQVAPYRLSPTRVNRLVNLQAKVKSQSGASSAIPPESKTEASA